MGRERRRDAGTGQDEQCLREAREMVNRVRMHMLRHQTQDRRGPQSDRQLP